MRDDEYLPLNEAMIKYLNRDQGRQVGALIRNRKRFSITFPLAGEEQNMNVRFSGNGEITRYVLFPSTPTEVPA